MRFGRSFGVSAIHRFINTLSSQNQVDECLVCSGGDADIIKVSVSDLNDCSIDEEVHLHKAFLPEQLRPEKNLHKFSNFVARLHQLMCF